ncbi:centromere protein T isoform X2 [Pleurodeles waltl]|uniref:centromere protein T isoform X2 n=1 Tax=Pleurodeles waltl TaxID=8319 RepID=UPI0037093A7E
MADSSTEELTFHTLIKKVMDTDANVSVVGPNTRSRSSDRRNMPSGRRTRSSGIVSPLGMLHNKMKDKLKRTSSASKLMSGRKTNMGKAVQAPLSSLVTEDTPRTILKHIAQTVPEVPILIPGRRVTKKPQLDSKLETTQTSTEQSLLDLSESKAGNTVARPKKKKRPSLAQFQKGVGERIQRYQEMNRSRQEETSMNVSLPGNISDFTRSFKLVPDSLGDPESVEKKGLIRRPKKRRMINVEDFEQRVEQNFQMLKGGDGGTQEELGMSSSAPTNQSAMTRSFKLGFDTPGEPESVEKKGLARRTRKHRIVNLENFEGAVEYNFQLLKGSQECFIEPSLAVTDQSINALVLSGNETDIVLSNTALYAQPLPMEQNLQDHSLSTSEPRPRSLSKEEVINAYTTNKIDAQSRLSSDLDVSMRMTKAGNEKQVLLENDKRNDVTMEDEVKERVDDGNGIFEVLMEKEAQEDLNKDDLSRVRLLEVMDFENLKRVPTSSCKGTDIISSTKLHNSSQAVTFGTSLLAAEELDDSVFQSLGAMYTVPSAPPNKRLKHKTETSAQKESQGRAETRDNEDMDHAMKSWQTQESEFELLDEKEGKHFKGFDKLTFSTANKPTTADEEEHLSEIIIMHHPDPEAVEEEGSAPSMLVDAFDMVTEIVVSEDAGAEEPISESCEEEDSASKLEDDVDSSFEMINEQNPASQSLKKEEHASSEIKEENNFTKYVVERFKEQTQAKAAVEEPSFEEEQEVEETTLEKEEGERGMQTYKEEENEDHWKIEVQVAGSENIEDVWQVQEESLENEETPEGEVNDVPKINSQENDPQYVVKERSVNDMEYPFTVEVEAKPIEDVGKLSSEEEEEEEEEIINKQAVNGLEDQEVENINLEEMGVGEQTFEDKENKTRRHTGIVLMKSRVFEVAPEIQNENTEDGKIPNKMDENASTYGVEKKYAMMEESASQEAEMETKIEAEDEPCPKVQSFDEQTQENGEVDEQTFEEEQEVEDTSMGELEEQTNGDEEKETPGEGDVSLMESEEFEEGAEVQNESPTEGESSEEEEDEFPEMEVQTVERIEENTIRDERKGSSPVVYSTSKKISWPSDIMSSQQSIKSSTKQRNLTATSMLRRDEKSSSTVQSSGWTDNEMEEHIRNAEGSFDKGSLVSSPAAHAVSRKTSRQSGTVSSQRSEKSATKERNQTATSTLEVKESSHPVHSRGCTDDEEDDHMTNVGESLSRGSQITSHSIRPSSLGLNRRSGSELSSYVQKSAAKGVEFSKAQRLTVSKSRTATEQNDVMEDEDGEESTNEDEARNEGFQITSHSIRPSSLGLNRRSGSELSSYVQKSAAKGVEFSKAHGLTVSKSRISTEQNDVMEDEDGEESTNEDEARSEGSQITSHSIRPSSLGLNRRSGSELSSYVQKSAAKGVEFSKAHRLTVSKSRTATEQNDVMEDEDGEESTDEDEARSEELTMDRNDFLRAQTKKGAELSSALATPSYLKPSNAKISKKLQIAKCAPKKNVLSKKEPRLPSKLIRQTFAHYAKMKVAKDTYEVVEKGVNAYLEQLSADLEAFAAHAGRTTVEASDVELLMRRQGLVTDEMPMNVLIERHLPLEYRRLLIPVATSGNKVVLR